MVSQSFHCYRPPPPHRAPASSTHRARDATFLNWTLQPRGGSRCIEVEGVEVMLLPFIDRRSSGGNPRSAAASPPHVANARRHGCSLLLFFSSEALYSPKIHEFCTPRPNSILFGSQLCFWPARLEISLATEVVTEDGSGCGGSRWGNLFDCDDSIGAGTRRFIDANFPNSIHRNVDTS